MQSPHRKSHFKIKRSVHVQTRNSNWKDYLEFYGPFILFQSFQADADRLKADEDDATHRLEENHAPCQTRTLCLWMMSQELSQRGIINVPTGAVD